MMQHMAVSHVFDWVPSLTGLIENALFRADDDINWLKGLMDGD